MHRREFVRRLGALGGSLSCVQRGAAESGDARGARQRTNEPAVDGTADRIRVSSHQSESNGDDGGDSGFVDRHRESIIGGVGVAALGALAVLAYTLRSAEEDATDGEHRGYERGNLLDAGEPRNLLEWTVMAANRPRSYAVMLAAALGGWILLTLAGYPGFAAAFLFGAVLFVMQWFLRFCWPYLESFYEEEPSQSDPESLRFEGFSTDFKVFLTLFAVTFLVLIGLILVGRIV